LAYEKLSPSEITNRLSELDGWSLRDDGAAICKGFKFRNFSQAFGFMTECALVAERMNHHPDWSNVYSRVDVVLSTHDAAGITELDFKLARAMDRAFAGRD